MTARSKRILLMFLLLCGVALTIFGQTALASDSSAFKVNLQVIDSISVSIDGGASGSNDVIRMVDSASGVTTYIVLD